MTVIPETVTPKQLAERYGWGEKWVRRTARALNACLGRGRGMRLTGEDVKAIMEVKRCPSQYSGGRGAKSGATTGVPAIPQGGFEDLLAQLTEPSRKELRPRENLNNGKVLSMVRKRS